ncbi:MAG: FAD-dependent oxidoreductase [Gammaproteobacteria bacterium]|nr:FAD-dependent oxidoreductase [Gammaproteobacteria bacterium]
MEQLNLGLTGFSYRDLFDAHGLQRLDSVFLAQLQAKHPQQHDALRAYRSGAQTFPALEESALLLACAPLLEEFVSTLFGVTHEVALLRDATLAHDPVFVFKKQFVQRRARRRLLAKDELESFSALDTWLNSRIDTSQPDRELAIAKFAQQILTDTEQFKDEIEQLTRWCIRALTVPEGRAATRRWVSFKLPQPTDHDNLVPLVKIPADRIGRMQSPPHHYRARDGFKLTDPRSDARNVQSEVNYCIYCHDHAGDFCSKGFPEKKGEPDKGLKKNPLGVTMTGCPLSEKISEMHLLKRDGFSIAALAMVMVDNPMCPATGHRICNDCMKACIYQKQEPVNIPEIETRVLTDVLGLPWGVEIYDLLTRWNPLRREQYVMKPYNGFKVLIAGMGPSGFTLAHHLLQEGCAVVGIEGLKVEPLPLSLINNPVRSYAGLEENLDTRVMTGFGGVAEYGITVRWDKNFLKLIYLTLARRAHFQVFGGVRFGGTITVENAWELGFDHLAIAVGAGLPQALPIPGSLAPGMRQANDFLMALQLTGAAKENSLANLQIRLPAVVIGGGLTGVDTATEVQAYYIVQVEKILARYEQLKTQFGVERIHARLDIPSQAILDEYLHHGRAVRAERAQAEQEQRAPDFIALLHAWGGVTIAYRRSIKDSPAYTRNHEEVIKALEEGIFYAEGLEPRSVRVDAHGHAEALVCAREAGGEVVLPARAILVATGARPNVAYSFEHKEHFAKERGFYKTFAAHGSELLPVAVAAHCKTEDFGAFTSYSNADKRVSFIGDTHPVFNGSVVKAIASGYRIYPKIMQSFGARAQQLGNSGEYHTFRARIADQLQAQVIGVKRVHAHVVELKIRAPLAVQRFRPWQFFRLQNFETFAPVVAGTALQTEALALTGAHIDNTAGTVSLLAIEGGASSRLVATLNPGDPVSLMGPGGVRTRIPDDIPETVMVVGGPLSVPHIMGVGPALRAQGSRVLYFAVFDSAQAIFYQRELEHAADCIVWVTTTGAAPAPQRAQDRALNDSIVNAIQRYAQGALGETAIKIQDVDRLLVIGDPCLIRTLRDARKQELKSVFVKGPAEVIGSINTPMQCMLKGVCSQCLQWQIDPATGKRTKAVFGCSWQDQPLDIVDLDNLDERLAQNRLQERLTNLWLDHLFAYGEVPRV